MKNLNRLMLAVLLLAVPAVSMAQTQLPRVSTNDPVYVNGDNRPFSLTTSGRLRVDVAGGGGGSSGAVAQGSTTAGQSGIPVYCASTTGAPTYTNGTTNPITCNLRGLLRFSATEPAGGAQTGGAPADGVSNGALTALDARAFNSYWDPVAATWGRTIGNSQGASVVDQNIAQSAVFTAQSSFTRPADTSAYTGVSGSTQGDLVANSTTAGSVTPLSFAIPAVTGTGAAEGYITGVSVRESGRKARHTFRVHLFQTTAPTVSNGDNGAAAVSNYSGATYLCYVDVVLDPSIGGQQGMSDDTLCPYSKTSAGTIYALLEAFDGYTPANAETIGVNLYANRTR